MWSTELVQVLSATINIEEYWLDSSTNFYSELYIFPFSNFKWVYNIVMWKDYYNNDNDNDNNDDNNDDIEYFVKLLALYVLIML